MITRGIRELYVLEKLSRGGTAVHRLHPAAKLIVAVVFIACVASFDRYAVLRLAPYIFYPTLMMAISETPYAILLKRFAFALPFCVFTGVVNIASDRAAAVQFYGMTVSFGTVSFISVLFRAYLCVMAVLILISVTPVRELTDSMRRLKIPYVFAMLFEMTYRYIGVLFEEAYTMYAAYSLRRAKKGLGMKDAGSFAGHLLLKSLDRAERIYNAMKCRGYALREFPAQSTRFALRDYAFLTVACSLCLTFRYVDIYAAFL